MTFRVPNITSAAVDPAPVADDQALTASGWITDIVRGIGANGVISGFEVTATGAADRTVSVAAGIARADGRTVRRASSATVTLAAADATNPRVDIVWIKSDGTLGKTDGVAAAVPVEPTAPSDAVKLAAVRVPAGGGTGYTVLTDWIQSRRVPVATRWAAAPMAPAFVSPAGFTRIALGTVQFPWFDTGRIYWATFSPSLPWLASTWQMTVQVTTAGTGGSTGRMAIYAVDHRGAPTDLLENFGNSTFSIATTGTKTLSPSSAFTLEPGRVYAFGVMVSASAQFVGVEIDNGTVNTSSNIYPTSARSQIRSTYTYGTWPATAPSVELIDNAYTPLAALRLI